MRKGKRQALKNEYKKATVLLEQEAIRRVLIVVF